MHGTPIQIDRLYPKIKFPVSRGTPMLSSLIKWNHEIDHLVATFGRKPDDIQCERRFVIDVNSTHYEYVKGHVIDGKYF